MYFFPQHTLIGEKVVFSFQCHLVDQVLVLHNGKSTFL